MLVTLAVLGSVMKILEGRAETPQAVWSIKRESTAILLFVIPPRSITPDEVVLFTERH
jgi:hypothetical protein